MLDPRRECSLPPCSQPGGCVPIARCHNSVSPTVEELPVGSPRGVGAFPLALASAHLPIPRRSREPHSAHRWQLEDAQDDPRGRGLRRCVPAQGPGPRRRRPALCAPFTALGPLVDSTRGSKLQILAQNVHEAASGAYTGEISAVMLTDLDVHGAVVGHSERRQYFGETDEALAKKLITCLDADLLPILCVGESDAQREAGETEQVLQTQVDAAIAELSAEQLAKIVVAYEPSGRSAPARSPPRSRPRRRAPSCAPAWRPRMPVRPSRFACSTAAR